MAKFWNFSEISQRKYNQIVLKFFNQLRLFGPSAVTGFLLTLSNLFFYFMLKLINDSNVMLTFFQRHFSWKKKKNVLHSDMNVLHMNEMRHQTKKFCFILHLNSFIDGKFNSTRLMV